MGWPYWSVLSQICRDWGLSPPCTGHRARQPVPCFTAWSRSAQSSGVYQQCSGGDCVAIGVILSPRSCEAVKESACQECFSSDILIYNAYVHCTTASRYMQYFIDL